MNNTEITQCYRGKSAEYSTGPGRFGGPGGPSRTAIPNRYSNVPPIQFKVTNELMQQFLTKLSYFIFMYSNKVYGDQTLNSNGELINKIMSMVQTMTLKDMLQLKLNDVNSMITAISSFKKHIFFPFSNAVGSSNKEIDSIV